VGVTLVVLSAVGVVGVCVYRRTFRSNGTAVRPSDTYTEMEGGSRAAGLLAVAAANSEDD
jgi:hypothetical protein